MLSSQRQFPWLPTMVISLCRVSAAYGSQFAYAGYMVGYLGVVKDKNRAGECLLEHIVRKLNLFMCQIHGTVERSDESSFCTLEQSLPERQLFCFNVKSVVRSMLKCRRCSNLPSGACKINLKACKKILYFDGSGLGIDRSKQLAGTEGTSQTQPMVIASHEKARYIRLLLPRLRVTARQCRIDR